ncbi:hypothetical protein ACIQ9Q_09695 [Streptomyces sp. NPDC094438]|uniref:hypothetical protein n=1 Tax=Streptomyces sp. NPDC094438 TaxID=3366061 RepID=UPI00382576C7
MNTVDSLGHERDPRIGRRVRDIASKGEGELTAIVREKVSGSEAEPRYSRLAYIKAPSGVEWSTAPENIEVLR